MQPAYGYEDSIRGLHIDGGGRTECWRGYLPCLVRRMESDAAIVAAHAELSRWLGSHRDSEWMPERVKDLMPHLVAAVGSRPRLPTRAELNRVRLTPITAGFRPLAELSVLIAGRRGLLGNASDEGKCKGVLLDVAELLELYVLAVLRRTWPGMDISHGTRGAAAQSS